MTVLAPLLVEAATVGVVSPGGALGPGGLLLLVNLLELLLLLILVLVDCKGLLQALGLLPEPFVADSAFMLQPQTIKTGHNGHVMKLVTGKKQPTQNRKGPRAALGSFKMDTYSKRKPEFFFAARSSNDNHEKQPTTTILAHSKCTARANRPAAGKLVGIKQE